jgi:hypothetical protein
MVLRRVIPLALLLPGLAGAGSGCAGRGAGDESAAILALRDSLRSTRASLAALDPAGAGGVGAALAAPPAPVAAPVVPVAAAAAAPSVRDGAWPPQTAALPSVRRAAPGGGPPPAEAAQLMGLTAEAVTRWIGEPALRRPEGPAEIWLYTTSACALDLVLYRDEPGGGASGGGPLRVAFAAARASGAGRQGEAACLGEIAGAEPAAAAARATTGTAPRGGGGGGGGGA